MKNKQNRICFDDLPVAAILYNTRSAKKPKPACVFERWMEGMNLSKDESLILIVILENFNYKELTELNLTIIISKLLSKKITCKPGLLLKCCKYLLISKYKFWLNVVKQFPDDMVHKLVLKVNSQKNKYLELKKHELRNNSREGYSLRQLAKKLVDENNFIEALKNYETMLGLKFQTANTYVHMARVLLLLNNYKQAETLVNKSWKQKKGINVNDAYVLPRILFLKIFFALIHENEYEAKLHTIQLKKIVLKEGEKCIEVWDHMEEIVRKNFVNENLKRSYYKFLLDVLQILTTYTYDINIKRMDNYELWTTNESILRLNVLKYLVFFKSMSTKVKTYVVYKKQLNNYKL